MSAQSTPSGAAGSRLELGLDCGSAEVHRLKELSRRAAHSGVKPNSSGSSTCPGLQAISELTSARSPLCAALRRERGPERTS
jgi:hypothetical protein